MIKCITTLWFVVYVFQAPSGKIVNVHDMLNPQWKNMNM